MAGFLVAQLLLVLVGGARHWALREEVQKAIDYAEAARIE